MVRAVISFDVYAYDEDDIYQEAFEQMKNIVYGSDSIELVDINIVEVTEEEEE